MDDQPQHRSRFLLAIALPAATFPLTVAFCLWRLRREHEELIECLLEKGIDPDRFFLYEIAKLQADERHLWRTPATWMEINFVRWSQRNWARST